MKGKERGETILPGEAGKGTGTQPVTFLGIGIVAGAYLLAAKLGLLLAFAHTNSTPIWPAAGIALAASLLFGPRIWPGIFTGAFLANVTQLAGDLSLSSAIFLSLCAAGGNTLEAVVGARLINRFTKDRFSFDRVGNTSAFIIWGALVATIISAFTGATGYCLVTRQWPIYGTMLLTWWLGDLGGIMIFGPVILTWRARRFTSWGSRKTAEAALLLILLLAVETVVFLMNYPLFYLILPFLLWTVFRFGQFETAVAVMVVMASSLFFAVRGPDVTSTYTLNQSLLFLQPFVAITSGAVLLISSLIIERTRADEEMVKARRQLDDMIEFLPDATFAIDRNGRVIAWNRAMEEMYGVHKEEMLGRGDLAYCIPMVGELRPVLIDLAAKPDSPVPPDYNNVARIGRAIYADRFIPSLNRHLAGAASLLVGQDGVPYGAIESIRDITEQKRAEERVREYQSNLEQLVRERTEELERANEKLRGEIEDRVRAEKMLKESEAQYRDLVESANSVILRMRPDGRITFFNKFARDFFGFSSEEIIGRDLVGTIVPPEESGGRDLTSLPRDIAARPEAYMRNVNENMRKNGERVWVAWTNKLIFGGDGKVDEILSIGVDITQLVRTEKELRQVLDDLAVAKERAETADRLKSAFLATMSHELRTPLNSIIGFTGILLQGLVGPLNEEQNKQLGMVRGSANHLLSLINDVLDISKIEAGQLQIATETFDLASSVRKIAQTVRPLAVKKGLTLTVDVSPTVETVESDARRVEQILLNLLSNAVKFTEEGGVTLTCALTEKGFVITVTDTGIGIRSEDLDRIFRPFLQIDTGLTRKYEGTGLGLSICRKLVNMLGGDLGVESTVGQGSTFTFNLPQKGVHNEETNPDNRG